MFRQCSRLSLDLRFPKRRRIGRRPIGRNASSLIIFCFRYSSYWRTRGTNKRQASLIRRTGLGGRVCSENIIIPKEYVRFGGRVAGTPIRQSFKNTWPGRNRRKTSAIWGKYSIDGGSQRQRGDFHRALRGRKRDVAQRVPQRARPHAGTGCDHSTSTKAN